MAGSFKKEMMTGRITALKVQERNKQRVNVFIDGEFAFGLSRITAGWLYIGQELTDTKIAQLQAEDTQEVAFQRALHFLEYRQRSLSEVRRNLEKHGTAPDIIEAVLERLVKSGYVDDARFAQTWIENRSTFRPRSKRALAVELRQRGLEHETIQSALEDHDEAQEEALAYQAAQKQLRKLAGLELTEYKRKLGSFLARRGFGYGVIRTVVERTWNELHESADDKDEDS
jgi:regulatory protein